MLRIRWPDTISNEEIHCRAETTKEEKLLYKKMEIDTSCLTYGQQHDLYTGLT